MAGAVDPGVKGFTRHCGGKEYVVGVVGPEVSGGAPAQVCKETLAGLGESADSTILSVWCG